MNKQEQEDLKAMSKLLEATRRARELLNEHADPKVVAQAYDEMRLCMPPNLIERMCKSYTNEINERIERVKNARRAS